MKTCETGHDRERLSGLLTGVLTLEQEQAAYQQIENCESCRRHLESLAGEPDWWQDSRELLGTLELSNEHDTAKAPSTKNSSIEIRIPGLDYKVGSATDAIRLDKAETADAPPATPRPNLDFLDPPQHPELLGRLGEYDIIELVGQGGMGVVLKAFDTALNRYVAIKVLAPHFAANAAARVRFFREAQAAAAVSHDHVIAIHAVSEANDLPFLVMPFIAGQSLQQRLDRNGPLSVLEILRLGAQAAEGLAAAHRQGLVHRDVKPANLMLEQQDLAKAVLTDFGLARTVEDASITQTSCIVGTPHYMSPEQIRGDVLDRRSDLFSLGGVLYCMCTGEVPFPGETTYSIIQRITQTEPRQIQELNPEIPVWLSNIVAKLLCKSPDHRFDSAAEVAELLNGHLAHLQQPLSVPKPAPVRLPQQRRCTQKLAILAATLFVCVAALCVGFLVAKGKKRQDEDAPATATFSSSPNWGDGLNSELQQIHKRMENLKGDLDLLLEE